MRLLSVLSAFVFSFSGTAFGQALPNITLTSSTSSTARAEMIDSLFGFEMDLHPAVFFKNTDREHVGFPTLEVEALLNVFEERIPTMKSLMKAQDSLINTQDDQIGVLAETASVSQSMTRDALHLADVWKEAAKAQAVSNFWDDLFNNKFIWIGIGALAGAGIYAIVDAVRHTAAGR